MEEQKVIDPKWLEQQNNVGKICSLDLRHRGRQQLILVGTLCVQPETLAERWREDKLEMDQGKYSTSHSSTYLYCLLTDIFLILCANSLPSLSLSQRCQPLTKEKSIFEDEKKRILAWKTVFVILFPQKCTKSDPWNKKVFWGILLKIKYLQLEKSTKYCKKEQLASLLSYVSICVCLHICVCLCLIPYLPWTVLPALSDICSAVAW